MNLTPSDLPASPTPGSSLRDQIAEALTKWVLDAAGEKSNPFVPRLEAVRQNSLARADAVMAVIQPELDELTDELNAALNHNDDTCEAVAERDQLRYERRLLGFARMTLDLVASGDESRWPQARREAEDIAQRIVDEIGHPATDEPALGPSLRAQLQQAEAVLARSRAALATFEGRGVNNFDIPTPAEIVEAWRASLVQQGDSDV